MSDQTLEYFLSQSQIKKKDASEVRWSHAVNSSSRLTEALTGPIHMIEADIIMRGRAPKEPIMAHPPDTDSDITLKEWLEGVKTYNKGIKLDFKSLEAVSPSMALLEEMMAELSCPVWINADILSGPGGQARPLEPQAFLSALRTLPTNTVLSLGWTTGWTADKENPDFDNNMPTSYRVSLTCVDVMKGFFFTKQRILPSFTLDVFRRLFDVCFGFSMMATFTCIDTYAVWLLRFQGPAPKWYSWDMVHAMEEICRTLKHPVTFPVRAALLAQSFSQLTWLLQQSDRYTLTVWTGQNDKLTLQDLLPYRRDFDISRIYYDLPDSLRTKLIMTSYEITEST